MKGDSAGWLQGWAELVTGPLILLTPGGGGGELCPLQALHRPRVSTLVHFLSRSVRSLLLSDTSRRPLPSLPFPAGDHPRR